MNYEFENCILKFVWHIPVIPAEAGIQILFATCELGFPFTPPYRRHAGMRE